MPSGLEHSLLTTEVAVVGAGISGLATAYALGQAGVSCKLLESQSLPGGLIQSIRHEQGFLTEWGATTFPSTAKDLLALCQQIGLEPQPVDAKANKRFIVLNGQPAPLPHNLLQALTSPVLPLLDKLGLLTEPFRPACRQKDISIADFFRYRFGHKVLNNLVDPFIGGIYAGDVETLSLPAVFPKLWEMEQSAGSLLKAALRAGKKSGKSAGQPKKPMILLSFPGGLAQLTTAMARALPENTLQTGCTVTAINQTSQGYQLRVNHSGDDVKNLEHVETVTCQHLVLATPAFVSAQLLSGISPALQGVLNDIPYNTLAVMHTGFNRADIEHPLDGFGMLVPQCEKRPLLGTIFASSLFPDRAPKDQVLLTNFLGGAHHPTVWQQSDAQISQKVLQQLQALLGLQQSGLPVFQSIVRYEKAIPQYTLGHLKRLETLKVLLKQLPQPTVHLCGNYLQHIALNGCVQSGLSVARQIILDNTHNHVD